MRKPKSTNPRYARGGQRPKRKEADVVPSVDPIDYHNDFNWYSKHIDYLMSVAKVSSNHSRGVPLGTISDVAQPAIHQELCDEASAISMLVAPTACGRNNPVLNTAQVAFYQFIRAANSGSRNYETADLFMYILAVKEYLSFLGMMKRLLQTLTYFEVNDRTVPITLVAAELGIQDMTIAQDLVHKLVHNKYTLLALLNSWITQFNTLAIPGNMPLLQKAYWMFNHVFKTDDMYKPTYACYAPATFLIYDETGSENGGRLITLNNWTNIPDASDADDIYDAILETGKRLLDAIMVSEDVAIISGDIRKAFGNDNLMIVAPLNLEKDSLIIHDAKEIKDQMHNARLWAPCIKFGDTADDPYAIEQRGGYIFDNTLVTCHTTGITQWISSRSPIIDIPANNVEVETFVEATRLTGCLKDNFVVYTDFWAGYDCILYFYKSAVTSTGLEGRIDTARLCQMGNGIETVRAILTGNSEYVPLCVYSDEPIRFTEDYFSQLSGDTPYTGSFYFYNPIHNVFKTTEVALGNIMEATVLSELNIPFIKS